MFLIKYEKAESPIHGTGLFAAELIPQGTTIWEWDADTGKEIQPSEFEKLSAEEKEHIKFFGYRSKNNGKYYYADDDSHFINHSENPNTTEKMEQGDGAGALVAIKDIQIGEEITQDYRDFESESDLQARGMS